MIYFEYFSFSTIHLELKDTFVYNLCSHGSLESHTLFKTIMVKIYTSFQIKTAQKPYPLGWHIPIWFIQGNNKKNLAQLFEYPHNISSQDLPVVSLLRFPPSQHPSRSLMSGDESAAALKERLF